MKRTLEALVLLSGLGLTSCEGLTTADIVKTGVRAAGAAGGFKTPADRLIATGIEGVADASQKHTLAKEGAPQTNVNVNTGGNTSGGTQSGMKTEGNPMGYDWNNILMDSRVQEVDTYGDKVVFTLPLEIGDPKVVGVDTSGNEIMHFSPPRKTDEFQNEIFIADNDGRNVKRLTFTIYLRETNPRFIDNGRKIEYQVSHASVSSFDENVDCYHKTEKINEKVNFCILHQAYWGKHIKKTIELKPTTAKK